MLARPFLMLVVKLVSVLDWEVIARDMVAAAAPEELVMFDSARGAFRIGPAGTVARPQRKRGEALGSGIGGTVTLVTPVVLLVVTRVLDHLADQLGDRIADQGAGAVRKMAHRLLRRRQPVRLPVSPAGPVLTAEQLTRVREVAFDTARRGGLREAKAELLADALVGGLTQER
jgi:hypothetical protein